MPPVYLPYKMASPQQGRSGPQGPGSILRASSRGGKNFRIPVAPYVLAGDSENPENITINTSSESSQNMQVTDYGPMPVKAPIEEQNAPKKFIKINKIIVCFKKCLCIL